MSDLPGLLNRAADALAAAAIDSDEIAALIDELRAAAKEAAAEAEG